MNPIPPGKKTYIYFICISNTTTCILCRNWMKIQVKTCILLYAFIDIIFFGKFLSSIYWWWHPILQVLEALKGSTSTRPAIFAMSNPTKNGMYFFPLFLNWYVLWQWKTWICNILYANSLIFGSWMHRWRSILHFGWQHYFCKWKSIQ